MPAIQCEALAKVVNSPPQESPLAFIAGKRAPTGIGRHQDRTSIVVGKPAIATDNAQFFHPRIQALPRLRSKEQTMKDTIRQLIQQALTQLVNEG
ncbi:MAG: argS, partial [Pseudomonas sp.]|nr:argS [Pseudomonas sp.]